VTSVTMRFRSRFALTSVLVMAQTRLAVRALPGVIRILAPIVAWAALAIVLGAIVGLAAVALPPLGAFGIVAAVGVVLLWVMPEVPLVYPRVIRKTFFVMLIVDLCVPAYYTIQIGDSPWISARRVATFFFLVPMLFAVASSSGVRRQIIDRASSSWLIISCAVGYLIMAVLSIPGGALPGSSLSAVVDTVLAAYVPFIGLVYLLNGKNDAIFMLKTICFCAIVVAVLGVLEFKIEHRFLVDVFPKSMLATLVESNPVFVGLAGDVISFRNGLYRAASVFLSPLSLGEFEVIVIPIGLFFAMHRDDFFERCLGWTVVISGMAGIFVSGSRGGYVGFIVSMAAFVAIWSIRKALTHRTSLMPALVGTMGAVAFAIVLMLVLFWPRAHNMVLGGGAEAASNNGRWVQWAAAWPFVRSNPITGHGFALGGYVIGSSIDSYVISVLLETGVPGFLFFSGLVLLPIWYGVRAYVTDLSESAAIGGALACSFIAFAFIRLVLSERENHFLMFILVAIVVVLQYDYQRKVVKEVGGYDRAKRTAYPRQRPQLKTG
jgi:O-antigen ligase